MSPALRHETKPMPPRLRWLVWANGREPRAVAAFAALEHAQIAASLLRTHHELSGSREIVAYLVVDLHEHGGGALEAAVTWELPA